jgi:transcriptional regulator with XRE-family HTH domain
MNFQKQFGLTVRKFRSQLGWSQEELAEHSELHRTYISGIERGVRNPSLSIILQIAKALRVHPKFLFGEKADDGEE